MPEQKCLIIMPAHNEEANLGRVIRELRARGIEQDLVIIDDGSVDRTVETAATADVPVLSLPFNLGYASAIQTGFKLAMRLGYDYLIQFDADGQHDPADIPVILSALAQGGYDVVIGSRVLGSGAADLGLAKKVVIGFFCWLIKRVTGRKITDPTSGLRGLSRRAFSHYAQMGQYPEDFPDADMLMHMLRSGFSVQEVPAHIRRRMAGTSQFAGLKSSYYVVKMLVSVLVVLIGQPAARGVEAKG